LFLASSAGCKENSLSNEISVLLVMLLSIAIFLVASKGWQGSSFLIKTYLLTTVLISSVYYFLPAVLNSKENIQKNTEKFKMFQKIQSDILAYSTIYQRGENVKVDCVLTSNYNLITANFDIFTTIDEAKINSNMQDVLKNIK
jgi:hypothetical protein